MNNYPKWWNSTITVYNKIVNTTTDEISWERTVLNNCFWKIHYNMNYQGEDMASVGSPIITCRVPKNDRFVDAHTWKALNSSDKLRKFTFQTGDIIINGKVTEEIDEYTAGKRSSDLVAKYKDKGVLRLSLFVDNSDEVRNLPHYYVR